MEKWSTCVITEQHINTLHHQAAEKSKHSKTQILGSKASHPYALVEITDGIP